MQVMKLAHNYYVYLVEGSNGTYYTSVITDLH